MQHYLFRHININNFISDLIEAVQTSQTLSSDFLQIYQPLPDQSTHYLVHIDKKRSFCLNERNVYLKNTMENLIAKSLKYISPLPVSASIHITENKDGIPYGTISILNNRELAKEIREKQQKGKEVYFQNKDGKIAKENLNAFSFKNHGFP